MLKCEHRWVLCKPLVSLIFLFNPLSKTVEPLGGWGNIKAEEKEVQIFRCKIKYKDILYNMGYSWYFVSGVYNIYKLWVTILYTCNLYNIAHELYFSF